MSTPFFPAWRARLAAFGRQAPHLRQQPLPHLEKLLGHLLPPGLLLPPARGTNSRQRLYSLPCTFWAFLWQVLNPACPCREVVRLLQALFCLRQRAGADEGTSAYCQARRRLPLSSLQQARVAVAAQAQKLLPQARERWHGFVVKVADGTTLSLPDTRKNQRAYPQSSSQKPGCGFPLMKLVGLRRALIRKLLAALAGDLVPERPGRREPRAVKRRPKPYPLLTKPRNQFVEIPHRGKYRKAVRG